jgi:hypothetical protein
MANESKASAQIEPRERIDLKAAVKRATDYFLKLFPQFKTANVMLEEVEENEDGSYWLITIGFDQPSKPHPLAGSLSTVFGPQTYRQYKIFKVDSTTGRVMSMKIRSLK